MIGHRTTLATVAAPSGLLAELKCCELRIERQTDGQFGLLSRQSIRVGATKIGVCSNAGSTGRPSICRLHDAGHERLSSGLKLADRIYDLSN